MLKIPKNEEGEIGRTVRAIGYVWSRQCFLDSAASALLAPHSLTPLVHNPVA